MKKFCSTCENILQHVCENILQHVCEKVQQRMCEKILQRISIGVHFDGLLDVSFHNRETISPNLDSSYFLGVSIVKKKKSRQKSFKCGMGEV